jgi:hypothetical protein
VPVRGAIVAGLEELIVTGDGDGDAQDGGGSAGGKRAFLQELKEDPGPLTLETLLAEITKLERVKAIGLPDGLFAGVPEKIVAGWRARAMKMYPSDLAGALTHPLPLMNACLVCPRS